MWWIYPLVMAVIFGLLKLGFLWYRNYEKNPNHWVTCKPDLEECDWFFYPIIISAVIGIILLITCPVCYYGSRSQSWCAEEYWESVIERNIIEEHEDYVVITNIEAAIWQAGDLSDYNSLLRSNRHWMKNPLIKHGMYPLPEYLKYVRVSND